MAQLSLLNILDVESRAGNVIASDGGSPVTRAQFAADVAALATRLRDAGCVQVLLATEDVYWGAVGLFGAIVAGSEAILPPNNLPTTYQRIGGANSTVVTDSTTSTSSNWVQLGEHAPIRDTSPMCLDPAARIAFYTSGSTGDAKRISKTLAHLDAEISSIEALFASRVPANARIEGTVPHQHAYGLPFRMLWPLATGRVFARSTLLHLEECLAALNGVTMLVTSPAHLNRLAGLEPIAPARSPCLVLSAGAVLPPQSAARCRHILGRAPFEIFGSSETGAIAGRDHITPDPPWRPLPGVTIAQAATGTLSASAPSFPAALGQTADLISLGDDGTFRFIGRSDNIVKIEGKRVSLSSVETALGSLDCFTDVAVGIVPRNTEKLAAAVVLSETGQALRKENGELAFRALLRDRLKSTLAPAELPRLWRFLDALPLSPLGKRRNSDFTALFSITDTAPPRTPRTLPHVTAVIQRPGGASIALDVPDDLVYLDGHFPGTPIVAGVVQITWAVALAHTHLGLKIDSAQDFSVKFNSIMQSGAGFQLDLSLDPSGRKLAFAYSKAGNRLSSGSIAVAGPAP